MPKLVPILAVTIACLSNTSQAETYKQFVKRMSAYFTPNPETEFAIDPKRHANQVRLKDNYFDMSKTLYVHPPKGKCIFVQKTPREPEQYICKKTPIPIKLKDLHPDGHLQVRVVEKHDPMPKKLVWYTPHRVGKFIDIYNPWPGFSKLLWVEKCTYKGISNRLRKYELNFFTKDPFIVNIPVTDVPIPKPKQIRVSGLLALAVKPGEGEETPLDEGGETTAEEAQPEEVVEEKPPEPPPAAKPGDEEEKKPEYISTRRSRGDEVVPDSYAGREKDVKKLWNLTWKDSYFTEGANIIAGVENVPGEKGVCRYSYSGYRMDPKSPALECKRVGLYQWLYLPMPCLKQEHAYKK